MKDYVTIAAWCILAAEVCLACYWIGRIRGLVEARRYRGKLKDDTKGPPHFGVIDVKCPICGLTTRFPSIRHSEDWIDASPQGALQYIASMLRYRGVEGEAAECGRCGMNFVAMARLALAEDQA